MPKMGESVAEATITQWLKNEGDTIAIDESILTIATDKVDSDIPSPVAGILTKKLFNENDVIKVDQVIGLIETGAGGSSSAPAPAAVPAKVEADIPAAAVPAAIELRADAPVAVADVPSPNKPEVQSSSSEAKSSATRFYSPLVRSMASQEAVSQAELDAILGSGQDGRVTKQDLLAYIAQRASGVQSMNSAPAAVAAVPAAASSSAGSASMGFKAPAPTIFPGDEIREMDRMRKLIADHMVMSKHVSPHVTSFVEADVTLIVQWRDRVKSAFEKREGERLTFTPIFMEAVVKAIKDFPNINVSVTATTLCTTSPSTWEWPLHCQAATSLFQSLRTQTA